MPSTQRQLLVAPGGRPVSRRRPDRGAGEPLDARHQEVGQAGRVGEVVGVGAAGAEVVGLDVLGEDGHGLAPAAAAPPGHHPDRLRRVGALDPEPVDPLVPAGPVAVHPGRRPRPRAGPPAGPRRPVRKLAAARSGPDRGGQPPAPEQEHVRPGHHHGERQGGAQEPAAGPAGAGRLAASRATAGSSGAGGGDADAAFGAGGGAGGHPVAAGDAEAAVAGDPDPAVQDLVAGPLDLVQDAAIQLEGDPDAGPGGGGEQLDARPRRPGSGPWPARPRRPAARRPPGWPGRRPGRPGGPRSAPGRRRAGRPARARRSSATSRMKLVSWKARPSWRACSRAAGGSADSRIGAIMVPITAAEPSM